MITIDFETEAIEARPDYPPKPVGVAVDWPGHLSRYYGWGHPTGNNCTHYEALAVLERAWYSREQLLFHNAKFDLDVAETHMGLKLPVWQRVHDTLFQLFLCYPHMQSLSLKPAAQAILGIEPEEAHQVRDYLIRAGLVKKNSVKWGAQISKAPGHLVGMYALGDVERTRKLHDYLLPIVQERRMEEAYDRERQLIRPLLENERAGIRVNLRRMEKDYAICQAAMESADSWLRRRLKCKGLNVDADRELADALDKEKIINEWVITETGQRSVAQYNLKIKQFSDSRVYRILVYRNKLRTAMSVFMYPWVNQATVSKGYIHTSWNQVRQPGDYNLGTVGARTGRLSSSPNFQNIPKSYDSLSDYVHPDFVKLPPLPAMRQYLQPDLGRLILHRDYNQQELRLLAHYEDDLLLEAYRTNPRVDMHQYVANAIQAATQQSVSRSKAKTMNFSLLYGGGARLLSERLNCTLEEARSIRQAQLEALPGLDRLLQDIRAKAHTPDGIRTWGGRVYQVEEPRVVNGEYREFYYKLINYLIQGSAADVTKQAILNYHKLCEHGRMLVSVHDEINVSCHPDYKFSEMQLLRTSMESVPVDCPMLTDGKTGPNWGKLRGYRDPKI